MGVLANREITVFRHCKAGRREVLFKAMPCTSVWSTFRGLMFSKKKNLLFVFDSEKKRSFHTWFVFFPIDVILLDSKKRIVEVKENFMPFTFYAPKRAFRYAVETSPWMVKKHHLSIGTPLFFSQQTL